MPLGRHVGRVKGQTRASADGGTMLRTPLPMATTSRCDSVEGAGFHSLGIFLEHRPLSGPDDAEVTPSGRPGEGQGDTSDLLVQTHAYRGQFGFAERGEKG